MPHIERVITHLESLSSDAVGARGKAVADVLDRMPVPEALHVLALVMASVIMGPVTREKIAAFQDVRHHLLMFALVQLVAQGRLYKTDNLETPVDAAVN